MGELAREQGARVPGRLVTSAKSWLANPRVDRRAPILPWGAPAGVPRLSPVAASARYLEHLRLAWDAAHPGAGLAEQEIVLTVPASFDEAARELTLEAAAEAGLARVTLIEEPAAAFYDWAAGTGATWPVRWGWKGCRPDRRWCWWSTWAAAPRTSRWSGPRSATGAPRSRGWRSATTSCSAATTWTWPWPARPRRACRRSSTPPASAPWCRPAGSPRSASWPRARRRACRSRWQGADRGSSRGWSRSSSPATRLAASCWTASSRRSSQRIARGARRAPPAWPSWACPTSRIRP